MTAPPEVLRLVRQWLDKAEEDWRTADYSISMPEGTPCATICFHAQQCVEKYIKALLVLHGIDFPRTHDVGELLELLPPDSRPKVSIEDQERLTNYATTDRYPGDYEPVDLSDAERALLVADAVRTQMRGHFPPGILHGSA